MIKISSSKKIDDLINKNLSSLNEKKILDFWYGNKFEKIYIKIAREAVKIISKANDLKKDFFIQKKPTLRIFKPKSHGSSFHSDYLLGHGRDTITVWIPLINLKKGNGVSFLNSSLKKLHKQHLDKFLKNKITKKSFNNFFMKQSQEIIPEKNQILYFSSNEFHGSPLNASNLTRYSFDFRIVPRFGDYGNKDLSNYYLLNNNKIIDPLNKFYKCRYIKYICGDKGISTLSQHCLINNFSREQGFNICAQEAEIERMNHPMLYKLINEKNPSYDGLLIYSKKIIPKDILNNILKDKYKHLKIIFVAENDFYPIKYVDN